MKLNPVCIRDILFFLEENLIPNDYGSCNSISIDDLFSEDELASYSQGEIAYHVKQLFESELLRKGDCYISDVLPAIADIAPSGHQLIANLHKDTVWNKILAYGKSGGAIAMTQFIQLAVDNFAT